ncbi:Ig-like domain-containing protein [Xanthomonas sp. NCPPB 2865]|uniref:Ig-like domain-containing protein n=1 Tax=unclassified Xanthomonas TaxID=2643310 RepID=UPI001CF90E88|nr:Ig-like domain-containing protein [Xanthomonas sp. MWU16-30325]
MSPRALERSGHSADCFFTGTDTFTYVVNDGKANSNTATVTVTVLGPNLPPLAFDDVVDLKENGSVRIDPTANDWDINGDDLRAALVCGPSHGSLSLNPDGTYTYTPDANWYGLDGFTYQAFDGQYRSNPAMVWIRVAPVNQAPVAAADAFTVRAGVATRLDVLANDSDVDGDGLTAKLATSPKNGTLTRNRDGSFSYTAKSGFVGTDTFTYVATDGALDSRPVTVSITVLAPNRAPVARDDKATTMAGAAVRIDVLGNDSDADGDRLATLIVCAPSHGKLSLNADGSYTYTPDKGWYGTDSFSYRATDGDAQSGVAMVSVTVQKVNRAPTAQSASFQVQKDGSVRIDFDCLVNDPDGDALTLSLTNPSKGSLTRNRDGSYTYRPKSGFIGTDTFTYSVSDGKLTASASITLVVSKNPPRDNAMSIVVGASASAASVQGGGYIVVNLGTSSQPVIDWTATAGTYPTGLGNTGWAALLGGTVSGIDLLVAQTGLVVRRD